jgi:16S rRNA (cytosine1402-N4)-methyltransferase
MMEYHNPVLLEESVDGLQFEPSGVYVDVTFGGGGHSAEILKRLDDNGRLYAFDQDEDARKNALDDDRFRLIQANFRFIKRFLRFEGVKKVNGILGDFGVSSHQFNIAERGFSTRFDGKLDMRMDKSGGLDAGKIINEYGEAELTKLFREYGELKNAARLASAIITERKQKTIVTSGELKEILSHFLPRGKENKILAQVFQAIRIEVNGEIEALKEFLAQTEDLLDPGGRLSLISYHSLEDRLVKRYIRNGLFEGEAEKDFYGNVSVPFKKIGKMITPSDEEIEKNNRARSAKLRIAEKI